MLQNGTLCNGTLQSDNSFYDVMYTRNAIKQLIIVLMRENC